MTIHNSEIAAVFNTIADLLEISNDNPFRIRAYRNAARVVSGLSKNAEELLSEGFDLAELPGIGKDLASKIKTIVKTGKLPLLNQLKKRIPAVLTELLKIDGLGPKRVRQLYQECGIRSMDDLTHSIESGQLLELKGFGDKLVQKIRGGMSRVDEYSKRMLLADAFSIAESIKRHLKKSPAILRMECAGSFRRRKETVGDLDFVVDATNNLKAIEHFLKFDEIQEVVSHGETRSTVRLHSGIQVDLRAVKAASYGAALLYFTGSQAHNIAIRKLAIQKKLKINEYGVFKGTKAIAGKTEKDVYQQIGLEYIEPELREDRGEIPAAKAGKLPQLITQDNIRGDLHCHTKATDGNASLEAMVNKAKESGYEYIAITDHSKHLAVARGFDRKRLLEQIKAIDKLNAKLKGIVILKSIEVDILEDGKLDLPNSVLKELDLTVCAVHSNFNLSKTKQTQRILRAMDNPYFNILAHPTCRLINQREACQLDLEKIMHAAKERGCILEVNSQPERMDLDDIHCRMAKDIGVKLVISTDSHSTAQMENMRFGVFQARRGWLEAKDVLNTRGLQEFRKLLAR